MKKYVAGLHMLKPGMFQTVYNGASGAGVGVHDDGKTTTPTSRCTCCRPIVAVAPMTCAYSSLSTLLRATACCVRLQCEMGQP